MLSDNLKAVPVIIGPQEQKANIAICSKCCFRFPVEDLETEDEGSWEEGERLVHVCPICPDGGCIDDYAYE